MLRDMRDTNTCLFALRADATSGIATRFNRHAEQLCLSSIVLAELQVGAETSQQVTEKLLQIELFVARLEAIGDFDRRAAIEYGRLRTSLRRQPIGPLDTLIAAHALSRRLILVTGNVSEFERVPGLEIESWD
jgi:tRNA(fMet)-specific endonuclease VapC